MGRPNLGSSDRRTSPGSRWHDWAVAGCHLGLGSSLAVKRSCSAARLSTTGVSRGPFARPRGWLIPAGSSSSSSLISFICLSTGRSVVKIFPSCRFCYYSSSVYCNRTEEHQKKKKKEMTTPIPQPPGVPLLGNIFDVNPSNTWGSLNKLAAKWGTSSGAFRRVLAGESLS